MIRSIRFRIHLWMLGQTFGESFRCSARPSVSWSSAWRRSASWSCGRLTWAAARLGKKASPRVQWGGGWKKTIWVICSKHCSNKWVSYIFQSDQTWFVYLGFDESWQRGFTWLTWALLWLVRDDEPRFGHPWSSFWPPWFNRKGLSACNPWDSHPNVDTISSTRQSNFGSVSLIPPGSTCKNPPGHPKLDIA